MTYNHGPHYTNEKAVKIASTFKSELRMIPNNSDWVSDDKVSLEQVSHKANSRRNSLTLTKHSSRFKAKLLQAESTKHRAHGRSSLLTAELRQAAKELRENNDIVIRRADKSDLFVILNRSEYIDKVDSILQDPSKFLRVKKNPIDEIRKKVTKLIDNANADKDGVKFSPLQGHYEPGYFYGNVKTHKPGNKLRHIISQIPTPTYQLAKQLNDLITPYIPTVHALRSTDEFVDLLRNTNPQGILASLDVERSFTNVNVEDTIKIILQNVFNHASLPPPKIPRLTLENMLRTCTKHVLFRCPSGKIYFQTDGVAMGSPLGVLFAQAYMCHLENHVLSTLSQKPNMYLRYIDDIFSSLTFRDETFTVTCVNVAFISESEFAKTHN
ncbi:uncharacterized protein LOC143036092 [Oratosquilla oratoria]|uniref:uncharacterized protein LOC143036092 n=1 Tax=Oratosquilla oratoria TaxID=337810 RepID=UPI003F76E36F